MGNKICLSGREEKQILEIEGQSLSQKSLRKPFCLRESGRPTMRIDRSNLQDSSNSSVILTTLDAT
jgi:hypothetical protein